MWSSWKGGKEIEESDIEEEGKKKRISTATQKWNFIFSFISFLPFPYLSLSFSFVYPQSRTKWMEAMKRHEI